VPERLPPRPLAGAPARAFSPDRLGRDLRAALLAPPALPRRLRLRAEALIQTFGDRLARTTARESDLGTRYHLAPGFLALGIATYFWTSSEPLPWIAAGLAILLGLVLLRLPVHGRHHFALVSACLFLAGMAAAQWRTQRAEAPMITAFAVADLSGLVLAVDRNRGGGARYLLRPEAISGFAADALPSRIRISAPRNGEPFAPGERIEGRARIQPLPGPAIPGGYDFRFFAAYDGLGGTGYFFRPPRLAAGPGIAANLAERTEIAINRLRDGIAARIRARLDAQSGGLAVALITGDRTGISTSDQDNLRKSGLAHILSISGLHMALVALTVIGSVRFLGAALPALALHYPLRKWAAVAGLVAATLYLTISGGSVPTQRSWLMIAVMIGALLADRRALTLRNVATAAILILLISPESLLEPGFQMSFAATGALIAGFGALSNWRHRRMGRRDISERGWVATGFVASGRFLGGIGLTSLMAGAATAIYSAWHFNQVTLLGLLGNGLAMPVVSLAVMPLALLSCLAMPFGFEAPFLWGYGVSLEWVTAIAAWVAGLGGADTVSASPSPALWLASMGLFLLIACATWPRWIGVILLACSLPMFGSLPPPDLLIAEDGRTVAVADGRGRLAPVWPRRNRFVTDIWLAAYSAQEPGSRERIVELCDRDLCILHPRTAFGSPIVWLVYAPAKLGEACEEADIVLAPRLRWVNCRGRQPQLILKRGDFERAGAHEIRLGAVLERQTPGGRQNWRIDVRSARNQPMRPWEQWFAIAEEPSREADSRPTRERNRPAQSNEAPDGLR
jgi:competence protein ComEC